MWSYEYTHHISPHNSQACHIFRLLPMSLAYFQAKVKSEFAYSRLLETLSCSDVLTSLPPPLYCSRYLGPWSYLHLINWVEEEIGLWRRISNTWSSSLFFVFQMHDICKSLFLVAHVREALLPPYTQTHCHISYHDDRNNCKGKVNDGSGYIVSNLEQVFVTREYVRKGFIEVWERVVSKSGQPFHVRRPGMYAERHKWFQPIHTEDNFGA